MTAAFLHVSLSAKRYFAPRNNAESAYNRARGPELAVSYDDLDIADGGDASAAFYRIVADPTLSPEARDGLRQCLLEYCERDTLALARVHQWLMQES